MFEIGFSGEYLSDYRRLSRSLPGCADEIRELVVNEIQETGAVPQSYGPHVLVNAGGVYNGCMEFHVRDDVLCCTAPLAPSVPSPCAVFVPTPSWHPAASPATGLLISSLVSFVL